MNEMTGLLPHVKLHFNVEHPTLEECYVYGYECALADITEEENPYQVNSKEHEQWLEGWWSGFYKEEPLFTWDDDVANADEAGIDADNDGHFHEIRDSYLTKVLEIAGVIAVSAILGYQVIDLVA
jgi:ribosome modulation factor